MIIQIICNTIMFASYAANIVYMVIKLRSLPKGLTNLSESCKGLSEIKTYRIHQKKFTAKFFKLLLVNLFFLLIGAGTCLLDGLSDTENGLLIPVWTFLIIAFVLIVFLVIYTNVLSKKYKIVMSYSGDPVWNRGTSAAAQMGMCMLIAFIFAFNSALTAYTIGVLII